MARAPRGGGRLLLPALAVCCLFLPWASAARAAAPPAETEFHLVPVGTTSLQLAHQRLDPSSVRVSVDGVPWTADEDYRVRSRSGVIVPLRPWREATAEPGGDRAVVIVWYRFEPASVPVRRDLRPVTTAPDPGDPATTRRATGPAVPAGDGPDMEDLEISGSKTVQVASGSRREMTVDQNLRLNISGRLTRDITVRAFLSDDNLPVVPEGNTEELRDIDKVLVEMQGRNWGATLGDFVAQRRGTVFGDYRRKLQGASVDARPGRLRFEALAGSPQGQYRTLQIRGQESNQGPYFLAGGAVAGNLFVVAGSERVTLDGAVLTRGADRDYVIDYVRGTITFTYRRLITAETTIVVEFEEGEGPYGRTVVGGGAGGGFDLPLGAIPGDVGVRVIRERDDPARLRTGDLAEEDEEVLRAAGDDPLLAVADGAIPVEPGSGLYDQQTQGGQTIYVHNPAGGDWNLELFFTGSGRGDYEITDLTPAGDRIYEYVGEGLGSYRIGRPLALPVSHSVVTAAASLGDSAVARVRAEWNLSDFDANVLSERDNDDNEGQTVSLAADMPERGLPVGRVGLDAFYNSQQASFRGFQLHKNIFDYDQWGLSDRARREGFLEEGEREAGARLGWAVGSTGDRAAVTGRVGTLRHGVGVEASQWSAGADWSLAGGRGVHRLQEASARDQVDPLDIEHLDTTQRLSWILGPVVPSVRYQQRRWEDAAIGDTRASGFRLEEWAGGLAGAPGGALDWRVEYQRSLADSLRGDWDRERDGRTVTGAVTTGRVAGVRLVADGTYRRVRLPAGDEETTRLAQVNLAGLWDKAASDWSLGYRVENSRAQVLARRVVFVGPGQGDYNQDGVYVGPGQGDHDLALAATDSLVATTAVAADLRWRQGFGFLGAKRWYGAWSFLSTASADSRSTTDDVGDLLTLDPDALFDPDHVVLTDVAWGQELNLLEHLRTVDLRGRFDYRQVLDRQFVTDPQDRLVRNWQFTGNVNVSRRSSVRLRWAREDERRQTSADALAAQRGYESLVRRWELGWNWRPRPDVRLGLQGEAVSRRDAVSEVSQREGALRPTGRVRFHRIWTLQANLRWAEVRSEEGPGVLRPWFYPRPGRNVESTLRLAWEPTAFLNVAANWFVRKQGEGRWQHDVRLESTARF